MTFPMKMKAMNVASLQTQSVTAQRRHANSDKCEEAENESDE